MILYYMRHGEAQSFAEAPSDAARKLTARGEQDVRSIAQALHTSQISFHRIISSDYVRAKQTASIIAEVTGYSDDVHRSNHLAPHGTADAIKNLIKENNDAVHLLLVGHLPSIGEVVSSVCSNNYLSIDIEPANICSIMLTSTRFVNGTLQWFLKPELVPAVK